MWAFVSWVGGNSRASISVSYLWREGFFMTLVLKAQWGRVLVIRTGDRKCAGEEVGGQSWNLWRGAGTCSTHVPLILAKGNSIIPSGHVLGCLLETAVLPVFVWIQYFLKWKSPWQQLQSLITEHWKWCWYLWGNLCSQNNVPLTMEWIFPANITI